MNPDEYVAKQSGTYGFIPKKAASSNFISGIRSVSQGRFYPEAFAKLIGQLKQWVSR